MRFSRSTVLLALAVLPALLAGPAHGAITQYYTATGQIAVSVDGGGSTAATYSVDVNKPSAGATVRNAFLFAATTGFSGATLGNTSIQLNAQNVTFTTTTPSAIGSNNYAGEVTSIVKPTLDAAAAGTTSFTVNEGNSNVDGTVLAVVWNDPAQTTTRTVTFLFGAQAVSGDTFSITLASPIDPVAAGAKLDMGIAISYSFQGSTQYSQIDVNGTRLTTSAGGQDDGSADNGALITVGGLGDSNANPANPNALPNGDTRVDDELYSLLPFITNTTTSISVATLNPSGDDNIFFAYFTISGAAVVGEGIVLSPDTATNAVGTQHTVTATVVNAAGAPQVGKTVTFNVISGPNSGQTGQSVTNAQGQAQFTYTSNGSPGVDQIQASFVNSQQQTQLSNIVTKTWEGAGPTVTPTPTATVAPIVQGIPTVDSRGLTLLSVLIAAAGLLLVVKRLR